MFSLFFLHDLAVRSIGSVCVEDKNQDVNIQTVAGGSDVWMCKIGQRCHAT